MSATREDKETWAAQHKLKEVEKKLAEAIELINEAEVTYQHIGDEFMSMECTVIESMFLALAKAMENTNRKALEEEV